jgi:hypothetical protein
MSNKSISPMSRRGLLQLGILAGLLGAAGCGGDDTAPTKVDTPPTEGGARSRLERMKDKAEEAVAKKNKKK